MNLSSNSLPARLIVGFGALGLLYALLSTSFAPLVEEFFAYRQVQTRAQSTHQLMQQYRADPITDYNLGRYVSTHSDVEGLGRHMQTSVRQMANNSTLVSVQFNVIESEQEVVSDATHRFIWYRFNARGDLASLDSFLRHLSRSTPQFLVQAFEVRDDRPDRPGTALVIEMQIGQLWIAPLLEGDDPQTDDQIALTALNEIETSTQPSWVDRSPFDVIHTAYSRPVAVAVPPPPPPQAQIRLLGISQQSGQFSASLNVDGREISVRVGDETAAGQVLEITTSEVVFASEPIRRVSLFD
jgi:hypothetical protein